MEGSTLLRHINGTALIIAALLATVAALAFPVWSYAERSGTGQANLNASTVATPWGPLSATDRDFLIRVRLAGLWELPAGQQAVERAPSQAIRDCGDHLVVGHTDLDKRARNVAAQLGVELPNQPNAQQQGWLRELSAAKGADYERKFANLLRNAHGKVFALIAQVRHTTRNTLIRQLATDANQTVLDHMTMLEATGFVDFDALANEAAGTTTASPTGPPPPDGSLPPVPPPVAPTGTAQSFTSRPSTQPGAPTAVNTNRPEPQSAATAPMNMPMPGSAP
jgi:predicted outer membrane protein